MIDGIECNWILLKWAGYDWWNDWILAFYKRILGFYPHKSGWRDLTTLVANTNRSFSRLLLIMLGNGHEGRKEGLLLILFLNLIDVMMLMKCGLILISLMLSCMKFIGQPTKLYSYLLSRIIPLTLLFWIWILSLRSQPNQNQDHIEGLFNFVIYNASKLERLTQLINFYS